MRSTQQAEAVVSECDEKSSGPEGDERYRVRSVERALDVLETLAEADSVGLRLAELSRRLDTSKSTVLAVLRTLTARGYVAELGEGRERRYRLGLTLARLGDQALGQVDLLEVALPSLQAMTEETGWTSRVGVLDDAYAVMLGRVDGPGIVRFQSNLARREAAALLRDREGPARTFPRTRCARSSPRPGCRGAPRRRSRTSTTSCASSRACGQRSSRSTTRRTAKASARRLVRLRSPGHQCGGDQRHGPEADASGRRDRRDRQVVRRYAAEISAGLGAAPARL